MARLNVWYGDERALAGKEAIADLTGTTLSRGTKNKDEQQIQAALDRMKANVSVDGSVFTAFFRIETVESDLEPALRPYYEDENDIAEVRLACAWALEHLTGARVPPPKFPSKDREIWSSGWFLEPLNSPSQK